MIQNAFKALGIMLGGFTIVCLWAYIEALLIPIIIVSVLIKNIYE